jgi:pimeloyl-ACP methyl ester carboxylesterase
MTQHHFLSVGKHKVFYREAGDPSAPAILLLHGFPTSSFMYRNLLNRLSDRFHLIAPDLPGFGFTESPPREEFAYSFASLTDVVENFVAALGLDKFSLMVFDYGSPVGFRLALRRPDSISAIISQNGNAYEEGLSENWNPIQKYWREPTQENRKELRAFLTPESTKWQYTHGVADPSLIAPEAYTLDSALLARPGNTDIQLDLFLDYAGNVALYPKFQALLRTYRIPVLAVWGKHDPFFVPAGAEAFKRDVPEAEVRFLDTGHFALETHPEEIAAAIRKFLVPARLRAVS